jgi:hypothetical protein
MSTISLSTSTKCGQNAQLQKAQARDGIGRYRIDQMTCLSILIRSQQRRFESIQFFSNRTGVNVTITRVGTNEKYASNWDVVFGGKKKASSGKAAAPAKATATKAAPAKKSAKKTTKAAKKAAPVKQVKKATKAKKK